MGSLRIDFQKHEILRDTWEEVMAKGRATGLAEGEAKGIAKGIAEGEAKGMAKGELAGMARALQAQLRAKFGLIPKWAEVRLAKANKTQLERWVNKAAVAQSLEGAIGKQP